MSIAIVLLTPEDEGAMASFLAQNALSAQVIWRVMGATITAESLLPALVSVFHSAPVETVIFPASVQGDELATRLAWRLCGSAVCQAISWDAATRCVQKAVYGNALTATLRPEGIPLCLSLSPVLTRENAMLPAHLPINDILPVAVEGGLPQPEILNKLAHPLQTASVVLATGQGATGEACAKLATALNAEPGFTRQRVMAGGCDEQRMLGISGQRVAPNVCLIAGASGASAFMAGVAQSRFIVAINTDAAAPVFSAADVGIVGDAQTVLLALAECVSQA
ncbi:FAD-binding protein [Scandinavium sp. H11S7]|uniref:FAD-binding protein n=1 Tax=Scandinavium hiltneri TaxID=2926519 RepID=A0ABT2DZ55_9ENTR|nr:FAD-binding protein [Scandinavium hiltneri]MCS2160080.1 FAD-binding protein [Scandinavium hiltneri]